MSLLEVDSIYKKYGDKLVLSDIFLACKTGDIIGITGRNGSGKSTLLNVIYGTTPAENKFVRLNGQVLQKPYRHPNGISLVPQHHFIPKNLRVNQVVKSFLGKHIFKDFMDDEVLRNLNYQKVSTLSKGELKYLEVKLILFNTTKFCMLDEPYRSVSPLIVEKINSLITQNSSEKGIIITDHNHLALSKVITSHYILEKGVLTEHKL